MAELTSPLLPDGVRVGAGIDMNERVAVRLDLEAMTAPAGGRSWPPGNAAAPVKVACVMSPRQARALAALLLKQADILEQTGRSEALLTAIEGGRS